MFSVQVCLLHASNAFRQTAVLNLPTQEVTPSLRPRADSAAAAGTAELGHDHLSSSTAVPSHWQQRPQLGSLQGQEQHYAHSDTFAAVDRPLTVPEFSVEAISHVCMTCYHRGVLWHCNTLRHFFFLMT